MPYSPLFLKQKIIENELAEKKVKEDAQQKKRAEQRDRAKEKKRIEQELSVFYEDIGRSCVEAALDGKYCCYFTQDPRIKYQEKLKNGGFEVFANEISLEEFYDQHPELYYSIGLDESLLYDDSEDIDFDCINDEDDEQVIFNEKDIHDLHHKLYKIFESGFDKINYLSKEQEIFFVRIANSRFIRGSEKSDTQLIGLKDLYFILMKYKNFDFLWNESKSIYFQSENAVKKLISHIDTLRKLFDNLEKKEKLAKDKILKEKYETKIAIAELKNKTYKIFQIDWESGGANNLKNNKNEFFLAWVLEWIADDSFNHCYFKSTFSFIEESILKKYSSCILDFYYFDEPYEEDDHKSGLFSDEIMMILSMEQIEGLFRSLGFQTTKKVKKIMKKDFKNLLEHHELEISWP